MARALSIAQWLVVAAMFGAAAVVWPTAPGAIPVHWTLAGQPDRYAGKLEGLLLLPVLALGLVALLRWLPRLDPRGAARYVEFADAYALIGLAITAVLGVVYAVVLLWVRGVMVDVGLVVGLAVGVLLIAFGVVMPRVRPNWFVGIRTPWTLSSEHVWTATHRVSRRVFFVMGGAMLLAGLVQRPWTIWLAAAIILGGIAGLVVYSYLVWRRAPGP